VRPVVAEFVNTYLPRTQTFVYGALTALTAVRPIVFARDTENVETFPFDDLVEIRAGGVAGTLFDKACSRLFDRRPLRELRYRVAVERSGAVAMHGHFGWSAPTTLPLKRDLGLPLVTTFYGVDMSALPRRREWAAVYEQLFHRGDRFLVEGGHMKRCLAALGCPESRIVVHHIGVDNDRIRFSERRMPDDGGVRILMCSSFVEKKGIPYGLEAFAKVRGTVGDARLLLAGDGPQRAAVEQLIDALGIRDSVDLLGFVDHGRFLELVQESHVFLAPSVTAENGDTEGGAPTVLLEAQSAGMPVVSTTHADIPEVVLEGRSGLLAPERDSDALADRLLTLISDEASWPEMGRVGRDHVATEYDRQGQARRLEEVYLSLVV
jgi:colanic acid/amylovoran biosynthesis glycosyltransferase